MTEKFQWRQENTSFEHAFTRAGAYTLYLLQYSVWQKDTGPILISWKSVVKQSSIEEHTLCSLLTGDHFSSQIILLRGLQETIH